jgi:electron transfer flavoprotein alpha subunit
MSVLAVVEQRDGTLHKSALEGIAAAQQIGAALGLPVFAAVLGSGVENVAQTLAGYALKKIHAEAVD